MDAPLGGLRRLRVVQRGGFEKVQGEAFRRCMQQEQRGALSGCGQVRQRGGFQRVQAGKQERTCLWKASIVLHGVRSKPSSVWWHARLAQRASERACCCCRPSGTTAECTSLVARREGVPSHHSRRVLRGRGGRRVERSGFPDPQTPSVTASSGSSSSRNARAPQEGRQIGCASRLGELHGLGDIPAQRHVATLEMAPLYTHSAVLR